MVQISNETRLQLTCKRFILSTLFLKRLNIFYMILHGSRQREKYRYAFSFLNSKAYIMKGSKYKQTLLSISKHAFARVWKNDGPPDFLQHVSNKLPRSVFALPWVPCPLIYLHTSLGAPQHPGVSFIFQPLPGLT